MLQTELYSHSADVALICETWFTKNHSSDIANINGFSVFRKDRSVRKGGGVAIYINESFSATKVDMPSDSVKGLEIIWVGFDHNGVKYYLAVVYHPPKPQYTPIELKSALANDIEALQASESDSVIIVGGDFNNLDVDFLSCELGLSCLATGPTHGANTLDRIFVNLPYRYSAIEHVSLIKTKHKLICAKDCNGTTTTHIGVKANRVKIYDLRIDNIDRLRHKLLQLRWFTSNTAKLLDLNQFYTLFVEAFKTAIDECVPCKSVTMRGKDPPFCTPLIKCLLKQRCKLRMAGRISEADAINSKIGCLINESNNRTFQNTSKSSVKELWYAVQKNRTKRNPSSHKIPPDVFNKYFTQISCDSSSPYDFSLPDYPGNGISASQNYTPTPEHDDAVTSHIKSTCSVLAVERMLSRIKCKSVANDGIPMWAWRSCSVEIADIVSYIFIKSITDTVVPTSWKCAIVTPIPKVDHPLAINDFRPISVVPILSRLLEKIVVKNFLYQILDNYQFNDQFAFRPLGSTTLALTTFMHRVTALLEVNNYVSCVFIDFTKAFDMVDRDILLSKIVALNVPNHIACWIAAFLSDRSQAVRVNGNMSSFLDFNRGVIQGTSLGPLLFSIMISDLQPVSSDNFMVKFADDGTLIVPSNSSVNMSEEFDNVQNWAIRNHMAINLGKTKEIIFHRPAARPTLPPPPLTNIQRVTFIKLLGINFAHNINFANHVRDVLSICSQRMFLLKSFKVKGLNSDCLQIIFHSLILSRILYALPAWGGHVSGSEIQKIDSLLKKCKKYGYTTVAYKFEDILTDADDRLFNLAKRANHPLNSLLPPLKEDTRALRPKGHNFSLPNIKYETYKCSFVIRSLFNFL